MKNQRYRTRHLVGLILALLGLLEGLALPGYPRGRPAPSDSTFQAKARGKRPRSGRVSQPQLSADYQFTGALTSAMGTVPELTNLSNNQFVTETVDGIPRTVLSFPQGGGLALPSAADVIPRDIYTIVMLFRFEDSSGWKRI